MKKAGLEARIVQLEELALTQAGQIGKLSARLNALETKALSAPLVPYQPSWIPAYASTTTTAY